MPFSNLGSNPGASESESENARASVKENAQAGLKESANDGSNTSTGEPFSDISIAADMGGSTGTKHFLFLQGPTNSLFVDIAAALKKHGHSVYRINLCLGDMIFWRSDDAVNFQGRVSEWPQFIEQFLKTKSITDIVLLGEQRIYHKIAIAIAKQQGINVAVTDFGYLRPDWVILELDGMNAQSRFPRDPDVIREWALRSPPITPVEGFKDSFWRQALWDMAYNLFQVYWPWKFPHYQRHTLVHPFLAYPGIGIRLLKSRWENIRSQRKAEAAFLKGPVFLFAMQTEDDFSLRAYSRYSDLDTPIKEVIQSFAQHASADASLLFKVHPLDPGVKNWRRRIACMARIAQMAHQANVAHRVSYIDGGDLDTLIGRAAGVITVNSTVGLRAIELGKPVYGLGDAIYRVKGLTHEAALDSFWNSASPPDPQLADAFIRSLAASVLVRGSMYSNAGVEAASQGMAYRLHHGLLNVALPAPEKFL